MDQPKSLFLARLPVELRCIVYDFHIRDFITDTISRAIPNHIDHAGKVMLYPVQSYSSALLLSCKMIACELSRTWYRYGFLAKSRWNCGNYRCIKTSRLSLDGLYTSSREPDGVKRDTLTRLELKWITDKEMMQQARDQQVGSVLQLLKCLPDYLREIKNVNIRVHSESNGELDGSLSRMEHDVGDPVSFCKLFPNLKFLMLSGRFRLEWYESIKRQIDKQLGGTTQGGHMPELMCGTVSTIYFAGAYDGFLICGQDGK